MILRKRRIDLEKKDHHVVIIDVICNLTTLRIIDVYRSFRPPNSMTPEAFFVEQLNVIKNVSCSNCYILGDFNLDAKMSY